MYERKKKEEENEYLVHRVHIGTLRGTQYVPELGGFYNNRGFYLEEIGQGCRII